MTFLPGSHSGPSQNQWRRVCKNTPCPICDHTDWCGISPDDTFAVCMRVRQGAIREARNGGWLHRLKESVPRPRSRVIRVPMRRQPAEEFGGLAEICCTSLNASARAGLAGALGVSAEALQRLRVGWHAGQNAYTFPMRDAGGNVLGIRLRKPNGHKYAVTGGREGLFIPSDLAKVGPLLVMEGPTDAAAMLDMGYAAVGRPSCTGGVSLLVDLVKAGSYSGIIIVADADAPGQRGAKSLANVLAVYSAKVRIIMPPEGIKDARAWKNAGGTAEAIQLAIDAAVVWKIGIKGGHHGN